MEPVGTDGAKNALWFFAERQLDVQLVWSPSMHNGQHSGKQPESSSQFHGNALLADNEFVSNSRVLGNPPNFKLFLAGKPAES